MIIRSSARSSSDGSSPYSSTSSSPRLLVDAQRLPLTPGAIEREHLLAPQPLAHRIAGGERLDLAEDGVVATERELGVDVLLERGQPELLEARDLDAADALELDVGERLAPARAPAPLAMPPHARVGRACALLRAPVRSGSASTRSGLDVQSVPGRPASRSVRGRRCRGGVRCSSGATHRPCSVDGPPDLVDQPVGRDNLVRMEQEQREDAALLLASDLQRAAVRQRLEWPEEPKFHGCANLTPRVSDLLAASRRVRGQ